MVDVSAPTNQLIQIDATSITWRRGANAVAGRCRRLRQLRPRHRARGHRRRLGGPHQTEGRPAGADRATAERDRRHDETPAGDRPELAGGQRGSATACRVCGRNKPTSPYSSTRFDDKIAAGTPLGTSATGTLVVQQATAGRRDPRPSMRLLIWAPAGALAGTLLAVAIVLAAARRDPRVRLRDDIADAIGSPVLAAIRSRPQRSVAGWSTLLGDLPGDAGGVVGVASGPAWSGTRDRRGNHAPPAEWTIRSR